MKNSVHSVQQTVPQALVSNPQHVYQTIARASSDAMMLVAPAPSNHSPLPHELSIIYVNEPFVRLTGYSCADFVDKPLSILSKLTAKANALYSLWQGIAANNPITQPWLVLDKYGNEHATELSLIPLPEANTEASYLLVFRSRSISDILENIAESHFSELHPSGAHPTEAITHIQDFINSMQMCITLLDRSMRIVAVNRFAQARFSTTFGLDLTIGAVVSTPILAVLGEAFPLNVARAWQGEFVRDELQLYSTDDKALWYSIAYTPIRDENDCVQYVAILTNDITASKETEDALELSLQRYSLATMNAKGGIWDWDLENDLLFIDPSAKALLGYDDHEFASSLELWNACVHPEDRDRVIAATNAHFEGRSEEFSAEYRLAHKDGTYHWILATARAIRNETGHPIRLIGTSMDITERKMVEQALQMSEGRFQAVWEASPDAMVLTDEAGNVVLANPAYYALRGLDASEVVGRPFVLNYPDQYQVAPSQTYFSLFESGILPKHTISEFESASGERRNVEILAEFVRREGQPVSLFSILRDVTRRNETEETLKRHARLSHALTHCSQLLLRAVADKDSQIDRLQETLQTLLHGLEVDYLALCKFGSTYDQIDASFCLEVIAPESQGPASPGSHEGFSGCEAMQVSLQVMQRLSEHGRTTASDSEITTGLATPTLNTYHLERVVTSSGLWGFITFGSAEAQREWKTEEQGFVQTAVEVIGNAIQRWEAEEALLAVQASLEQQVQQRTAMLFQTIDSLQRQIRERKRAEVEVRRRLNVERALRDISARLMRETNFDRAAAATLADIGEKLNSEKVVLLRLHTEGNTFTGSHSWTTQGTRPLSHLLKLAANEIPQLLKHLRQAGYLLVAKLDSAGISSRLELEPFQDWYSDSLLILPLNVSDELVGLLFCCDAERLQEEKEEGLHFVQAAVGMLSAMLRIDQMVNALEKRVAEQTEELAAFFNMAVLASGSEHVTETLAAALTMIKEIGNCDAVCVHILSPDGAALQLSYQIGLDQVDHRHLQRFPRDSSLYQRIQRTSTPIFVTELNPTEMETRLDEFHTFFGAPMVVRNNVQGLLSCYWRFVHSVSLNQMSLLTALTDQLGIILENQRLHRHAQEAGIVHERQRLARELHDSVTQSMYGVMIFARAGREALEDNDFVRLSDCLTQVEGASLRSLKEMRLLLYQLRPLALESQGLVEAIRSRLDLVENRLGIDVNIQMAPIVGLTRNVEETLYHVAMEALNNILKHADADRVTIQLLLVDNNAELSVIDDGIGFEINETHAGMGLTNMRDRVKILGGEFSIQTKVDQGTSILARIPLP